MLCVNWLPRITCVENVWASRTKVNPGQRVVQEVQPPEYVVWTGFCLPSNYLFCLANGFLFYFQPFIYILLPFSVSSFFHRSFNVLFYFQFPNECEDMTDH